MRLLLLGLVTAGILLSAGVSGADSAAKWQIESVSLRPDADPAHALPAGTIPNRLTALVLDIRSKVEFVLSSDVRLTSVKESFISADKFVAMGDAGNASAVVVFDVSSRRLIDWFDCYAPRRVSDDWIACIEWYPRFIQGEPREVMLIYDLARTPAENRLPGAVPLSVPAPIGATPVQVGIPVFPVANVREHSYGTVVQDYADGGYILRSAGYLLLPRERLVFAAAQGRDFPSLRDYLVVVDLSNGLNDPVIRTVDIPTDQLSRPGENPEFVKINGIEAASKDSVRLLVPENEYGLSSVVVKLPAP